MTKAEAIYSFFSGFGLTAYEQNTIPTGEDAPAYPFLTYSFSSGEFGYEVNLTCELWYYGSSWKDADDKVDSMSEAIGRGGIIIQCDDGAIWLKRGEPFAQSMNDPNDNMIKRKYLNVIAEYITAD